MSLTVGDRFAGHFEVTAVLGAGGMGEVYSARDTRLNRAAALKILPDAFAADPDRLARFQREAELLASLNHPNIAQIHGIEEEQDEHAGARAGAGSRAPRWRSGSRRGRSRSPTHWISPRRSRTPSRRRTRPGWSTATSSRPTSRCAKTEPSRCSTSGWPRPWTESSETPEILSRLADHGHGRDPDGGHRRDGRLHVSGTGAGEGGRQADRCLGVRRRTLRDAHRDGGRSRATT